jgi:ComF family protein
MIGRWAGRAGTEGVLLARGMLSLFIPPLCVACERRLGSTDRWLCRNCRIALAREARPLAREIEIGGGKTLRVRYSLRYTARVSRIIAEMKYGDKPGLAGLLVPFVSLAVGGGLPSGTVAVPVPIHRSKRRERGFNQSLILAEALAALKGIAFEDLLVKRRMTDSQTALEREERAENVAGCFGVREGRSPGVERALLVDDVVTTGSTLRECALALMAAGTEEISACAVASS